MDKSAMVKEFDELKEKHADLRNAYNRKREEYKEISELFNKTQMENEGLKQRIVELEGEIQSLVINSNPEPSFELPINPMEVALMLINADYEYETSLYQRALGAGEHAVTERYTIDELEQIAEHLLIHCRHNKEDKNE